MHIAVGSLTSGKFNILRSHLTPRLQLALIAVRSKLYFTGAFKAAWTRLLFEEHLIYLYL